MTEQPSPPIAAPPAASRPGTRGLRADARRNRDRVVLAARELFAARGLDVPLDEIADRAGVGAGTVHRHFPTKNALYLAVATDMLERLIAEADRLIAGDDDGGLYTLLAMMISAGAENVTVKSALAAAEFDLRTTAPDVAAGITDRVARLLERAQAADLARGDVGVEEVLALVAGAFTALQHAGTGGDPTRSGHLAQILLDGLRTPARSGVDQ